VATVARVKNFKYARAREEFRNALIDDDDNVTDAAHADSATDSMCGRSDLPVSFVEQGYKDRENGNKDGKCHTQKCGMDFPFKLF
jgi:hypothetical protein